MGPQFNFLIITGVGRIENKQKMTAIINLPSKKCSGLWGIVHVLKQ